MPSSKFSEFIVLLLSSFCKKSFFGNWPFLKASWITSDFISLALIPLLTWIGINLIPSGLLNGILGLFLEKCLKKSSNIGTAALDPVSLFPNGRGSS